MKHENEISFDILGSFFSKSNTVSTVSMIEENEFTGWEKWLQIELAHFISNLKEISEINIEEGFRLKQNFLTLQEEMRADICFRPRGWKRNSFIYWELKQKTDFRACIRAMLKDYEKMSSARKRSFEGNVIRAFLVVGVFKIGDRKKRDVIEYINSLNEDILYDGYVIKKIRRTEFYWLSF